jgi:hypothetical protein
MKRLGWYVMMLAAWAGSVRGGGFNPERISADASWVVHVDLAGFKKTQLGGFVWKQLMGEDVSRKLAAFDAIFNFDPRRDVTSVTVYGKDANPQGGVLFLRGTFDGKRLATLVQANDGYAARTHGAHTLHVWKDKKQGGGASATYGTVLGDNTVVVSATEKELKAALDVLDGKAGAAAAGGKLGDLSAVEGSPFFMVVAHLADMQAVQPRAVMFKHATSARVAMDEKAGRLTATVVMNMTAADKALQMQTVAQGLVAFGQMAARKHPELGKLADAVKISVNGTTIKATLSYPVADMIKAMELQLEKVREGIRKGDGGR